MNGGCTSPYRGASRGSSGWRDPSGRMSFRGLVALFLVAAAIYAGMKLIPIRAAALSFDDAVRDEVIFAASRRSRDEDIRKALLDRARDLGLPVRPGDIEVRRPGTRYIVVEVNYTVPVEFVGGYVFEWSFNPRHEGPLI